MDVFGDDRCQFRMLVGTGGIGWGQFFALTGNHTLGREESRLGRFLDQRDYCKLHIVSHYISKLCRPDFRVLAIGKVGQDEPGKRLIAEMRSAGLDVSGVQTVANVPTLHCICLLYPDGSSGNLTVEDSASSLVDAACIADYESELAAAAGQGIALAVPEVPMEARVALLKLASGHQLFRVASFVAGKVQSEAVKKDVLPMVDLLALNAGEAAGMCGLSDDAPPAEIAHAAAAELRRYNSGGILAMTAGASGSWICTAGQAHHLPAIEVDAASAAGAGDAFLSGLIAGMVGQLSLDDAHQLAALTAAASVTSPHTIHEDICPSMLVEFGHRNGVPLSPSLDEYLKTTG